MKYSAKPLFRHFRRNYHLTQRELAIALGCTVRHVKYVEAGEKFPSAELMGRFKYLVNLHELEREAPVEEEDWRR